MVAASRLQDVCARIRPLSEEPVSNTALVLTCRVQGSGFRVQGSGFRVQNSWLMFRDQAVRCRTPEPLVHLVSV